MKERVNFAYDVLLAGSSKDIEVLNFLEGKLHDQDLRVWATKSGVLLSGQEAELTEDILSETRVLVLFISKSLSPQEWNELERYSIPFRTPGPSNRRFVPVRIDNAETPLTLRHFGHLDWRSVDNRFDLERLVQICRPHVFKNSANRNKAANLEASNVIRGHLDSVSRIAITPDGKFAISGAADEAVRIWNLNQGTCAEILDRHTKTVVGVAISPDAKSAVSASLDGTIRIWSPTTGRCTSVIECGEETLTAIAVNSETMTAIVGTENGDLQVWDLARKKLKATLTGHKSRINGVALTADARIAISASNEGLLRIWDLSEYSCISKLQGHHAPVNDVAISFDGRVAVSGSDDRTVKLWSVSKGKCIATLEGHTKPVWSVGISNDGTLAASGSADRSVKIWGLTWGDCIASLYGHSGCVSGVAITPDGRFAVSAGHDDREIRVWALPEYEQNTLKGEGIARYTNAKVLLVGDSGVGKTGLALRLVEDRFEATISSNAAWATQLKLTKFEEETTTEKEIWLWDFGGQADYRLIHQLFMDETALAFLVFNPQMEDPFDGLAQWDRALQMAARRTFRKILVAGRCDRGGLTVSRQSIDNFCKENGFEAFFETSALTGLNCDRVRKAMINAIQWKDIPWRASPVLFKQLKDLIIEFRDEGRVLLRVAELKQQIQLRLPEIHFSLEELRAVIALLAGPGVVWQLEFGDFVLLQPEVVNSYAAAVIRSVRSHLDEIGCIPEEQVLSGSLIYNDSRRLPNDEEQIVLRALNQILVQRGLCLREQTDRGSQLIFPAYFKRERPALEGHPAAFVSYRFSGQLDEIYATLVIRLHHTPAFEKDQLWRFAADFRTQEGRRVGLKMEKKSEGFGEISVYFDPLIPNDTKVTFIRYVHEHLEMKDPKVVRTRHYICPNVKCAEPVEGVRAIQKAFERKDREILCQFCRHPILLSDLIERKFASTRVRARVKELDMLAQAGMDNESKELVLIGHAFAIAGEAGQIFRPTANSDWGIDGEIEFKDSMGNASGKRVYLQLKSGDSYLYRRKDGDEIFQVKNERLVKYWGSQSSPVMLVVRTSSEGVRWMDVSAAIRRERRRKKSGRSIVFSGEEFSAENLLRMREDLLGEPDGKFGDDGSPRSSGRLQLAEEFSGDGDE